MKTFVNASSVKRKDSINSEKVFRLIDKFNRLILEESQKNDTGAFYLNTGLDKVPNLSDAEFEYIVELAKKEGWKFTQYDDNYTTTTYKMEMIN